MKKLLLAALLAATVTALFANNAMAETSTKFITLEGGVVNLGNGGMMPSPKSYRLAYGFESQLKDNDKLYITNEFGLVGMTQSLRETTGESLDTKLVQYLAGLEWRPAANLGLTANIGLSINGYDAAYWNAHVYNGPNKASGGISMAQSVGLNVNYGFGMRWHVTPSFSVNTGFESLGKAEMGTGNTITLSHLTTGISYSF